MHGQREGLEVERDLLFEGGGVVAVGAEEAAGGHADVRPRVEARVDVHEVHGGDLGGGGEGFIVLETEGDG